MLLEKTHIILHEKYLIHTYLGNKKATGIDMLAWTDYMSIPDPCLCPKSMHMHIYHSGNVTICGITSRGCNQAQEAGTLKTSTASLLCGDSAIAFSDLLYLQCTSYL